MKSPENDIISIDRSNQQYPVYNLIDKSTPKRVGQDLPVLRGENGKIIFRPFDFADDWNFSANECVASRILKFMEIRAAKNDFALQGKNVGVISEYFLENGENIETFKSFWDGLDIPAEKRFVLPHKFFQTINLKSINNAIKNSGIATDLTDQFLASILLRNTNHLNLNDQNIHMIENKKLQTQKMAPYHGFKRSMLTAPLTEQQACLTAAYHKGLEGNMGFLKTDGKQAFEKFMDGLSKLNTKIKSIADLSGTGIEEFARHTNQYDNTQEINEFIESTQTNTVENIRVSIKAIQGLAMDR